MSVHLPRPLTTFADMRHWADLFTKNDDGLGFLIVIGPPGTGKSRIFKNRLGDDHVIEGKLTGVMMYMKLHELRNELVCFDDVDPLLKTPDCVNLLKLVCNTDAEKTLQWNTASRVLLTANVPHRFRTRSRVVIVANTLDRLSTSLSAVIDRAFVIEFRPAKEEVHREAGTWFEDKEIYGFIECYLADIDELSLRAYVKALALKRAGGDWQQWLRNSWDIEPKLDMVVRVLRDPTLVTAEQRVQRFADLGGGSRDTFMRWQRKARTKYPELQPQQMQPTPQAAIVDQSGNLANVNTSILDPGIGVLPDAPLLTSPEASSAENVVTLDATPAQSGETDL